MHLNGIATVINSKPANPMVCIALWCGVPRSVHRTVILIVHTSVVSSERGSENPEMIPLMLHREYTFLGSPVAAPTAPTPRGRPGRICGSSCLVRASRRLGRLGRPLSVPGPCRARPHPLERFLRPSGEARARAAVCSKGCFSTMAAHLRGGAGRALRGTRA